MSADPKTARRELLNAQVERDVANRLRRYTELISARVKKAGRSLTESDRFQARTFACMNRAERRRHFGTTGPDAYAPGQMAPSLKTRRTSNPDPKAGGATDRRRGPA